MFIPDFITLFSEPMIKFFEVFLMSLQYSYRRMKSLFTISTFLKLPCQPSSNVFAETALEARAWIHLDMSSQKDKN